MKKEEFIKLAPKCGYGSEDQARDYTERNPKMHYSVDDFIKLYHEQQILCTGTAYVLRKDCMKCTGLTEEPRLRGME